MYKINKKRHSVIFCGDKKESHYILQKLKLENTDKKILIIFDNRLEKYSSKL